MGDSTSSWREKIREGKGGRGRADNGKSMREAEADDRDFLLETLIRPDDLSLSSPIS
jgi:hypothetical protein